MIAAKMPLSIYIHIPFCERKCAYCDFVSFDNRAKDVDKYISALCEEIKIAKIENADTIFIGGGTPSLLTNEQLSKIFELLPKASEITIEANPNSITAKKLEAWRKFGINRLSIGIQSFDDEVLKTLGRIHNADQAITAIKLAAKFFNNINIDLIHSVTTKPIFIPSEALEYVTHVSAYCLIIEEGKPFTPIPETQSIKQQKQIEQILKKHNFEKYEVSNFARKKSGKLDYKCRHNLAYWKPETHEYIGFGLGAHSLFDNCRFSNTIDFDEYLLHRETAKQTTPRKQEDILTETIMLGLRTTDGVEDSLLQHKLAELQFLEGLKLIKKVGNRICATAKGFLVLNQIIGKLT